MWKHITLVRFFYWLSTGSVYYLLMHIGSIQLMIIPGHLIYFFNGQEIHLSALGAKRHRSLTLCVYDLKWMWINHALGPPWGSLWCRDIDVMTSEQTLWGITHSCSQRHGDGTQCELFFHDGLSLREDFGKAQEHQHPTSLPQMAVECWKRKTRKDVNCRPLWINRDGPFCFSPFASTLVRATCVVHGQGCFIVGHNAGAGFRQSFLIVPQCLSFPLCGEDIPLRHYWTLNA